MSDPSAEPTVEADVDGAVDHDRRRARGLRVLREAALVLALACVGFLVAGLTGALVAGAAVVAGRLPAEQPGKPVAMASFFLLAAAAVASVVEADPGAEPLSLSFPLQRPLAADLGAAAGILLLAAVVTSAVAERSRAPVPEPAARPAGDAPPAWRTSVAAAATLAVAFVVRVAAAPQAVADGLDPVVAAVAAGEALVVPGLGLVAPAAPVVVALWPGGGTAALVAAGVLLVVATAVLAVRTGAAGDGDRRRTALAAGVLAAVAPSMWLLDLGEALAGLAAVAAVLLAVPARVDATRAVAAGVAAALAVLARPDTIVLGPVLVVWLLAAGSRRGVPVAQVRAAWVLAVSWVVVVGCWAFAVHGQVDDWNPLRPLGPEPTEAPGVAPTVVAAVLAGALLVVAALGVHRRRGRLVPVLPLLVLPLWALVAGLVLRGDLAGLLGWGAPFVVALAGQEVVCWVRPGGRSLVPDPGAQRVARTSA